MRIFDLHCDTLYKLATEKKDIYKNYFHVDILRAKNYTPYVACFAIWIPDELRGEEAFAFFNQCTEYINAQASLYKNDFKLCKNLEDLKISENKCDLKPRIILTVEGGRALAGKIENVEYLSKLGVKILTLTWNGKCEIGDGAEIIGSKGLTAFGKDVVRKMENCGMIVDVSHASEKLFYDVAQIANKPFIATHSNSANICSHRRNLTDEQFKIIREHGGLVGITFCKDFLTERGSAEFDDIRRHTEHFLELGGENTLAIGSDFDGATMPEKLCGVQNLEDLHEYFLIKKYSEELIDKMFFKNAYNFMLNYF